MKAENGVDDAKLPHAVENRNRCLRRDGPGQTLAEYLAYLEALKPGDWGSIEIEQGESQRAVKRRTSTAAKQGKQIRWRRSLSDQQLVFEVLKNA